IESYQEGFCNLLRSTKREGIEQVIRELDSIGYFEAPASASHHLNKKGGLMEHSLNVCSAALDLQTLILVKRPELKNALSRESVIITSLLHDVCKSNIYKETLVSRKNDQGYWVKEPGYAVDCSDLPLGHGEKSVIMLLSWGLKLTRDEMLAIRWHMTAWDLAFHSYEQKTNLEKARETTPLCYIVQCADSLSSGILEKQMP
ncbi:MAG: TraI domain-containing protein, partial [Spirochaetales bacterium]|nr:TraI domain-containing protein [Spirochaetales bacterium]